MEISGKFSDYLVSCEALPDTSSFSLYFHSKKLGSRFFSAQEYKNAKKQTSNFTK